MHTYLYMGSQVAPLSEYGRTELTLVRLQSCVFGHVHLQRPFLIECTPAYLTDIWTLSCAKHTAQWHYCDRLFPQMAALSVTFVCVVVKQQCHTPITNEWQGATASQPLVIPDLVSSENYACCLIVFNFKHFWSTLYLFRTFTQPYSH